LTLIDSGESGGFVWYVLPYVRGESLRAKLAREKQFSIEEAVRIATQVASALDYAHRHGVIHRDIKPENILLHEGEAVVADFGIALAVSQAGGTRLTETGLSLGTPFYMSPEQALGDRQIDARSDIYSLGALLYEMLAGDPPYLGSTAQAVVAQILTETPRPLGHRRRAVPAHIERAVHRALEKAPADRFGTAAEFAQALTHPGVPVTPLVSPARIAGGARAHPWRTGAVLAILAAGVAVGWWGVRRAGPPRGTELPSIAVLPFVDMSASRDQAYFGDGMAEEILNSLSQLQNLRVASRTSAFKLRDADITTIGGRLGVGHVLEGSVRRQGDTVRISAQLIAVKDGFHLWSET
ncbi:MAG: protein kinase domain-containing protein, partial [Gemmatimonadales bacterium]